MGTGMRRHNAAIFTDVLKQITPLYLAAFAPQVHCTALAEGLFEVLAASEMRRVETLTEVGVMHGHVHLMLKHSSHRIASSLH